MKVVVEVAVRVSGNSASDAADIFFQGFFFGSQLALLYGP